MELNNIPKTGNYGSGVDLHNDNYSKIGLKLDTLENVSFNEKGYFEDLSSLQSKYPTPQPGWQAYVKDAGSSTGYYVANVNSSGNWVITSAEAPSVGVNLNDYALNGGSEKTVKDVEDEIVQLAGNSYILTAQNGININEEENTISIRNVRVRIGGTVYAVPDTNVPVIPVNASGNPTTSQTSALVFNKNTLEVKNVSATNVLPTLSSDWYKIASLVRNSSSSISPGRVRNVQSEVPVYYAHQNARLNNCILNAHNNNYDSINISANGRTININSNGFSLIYNGIRYVINGGGSSGTDISLDRVSGQTRSYIYIDVSKLNTSGNTNWNDTDIFVVTGDDATNLEYMVLFAAYYGDTLQETGLIAPIINKQRAVTKSDKKFTIKQVYNGLSGENYPVRVFINQDKIIFPPSMLIFDDSTGEHIFSGDEKEVSRLPTDWNGVTQGTSNGVILFNPITRELKNIAYTLAYDYPSTETWWRIANIKSIAGQMAYLACTFEWVIADGNQDSSIVQRNTDIETAVDAIIDRRYNDDIAGMVKRFTFLHESDIHGDTARHNNIVDYLNYKQYIDALIVTGDIVMSDFTSDFTFFEETKEKISQDILPMLGNHDVGNNFLKSVCGTDLECYNRYIEPFEQYGIVTNGKNYWYKDYSNYKIRIIAIYEYDNEDTNPDDSSRYRIQKGFKVFSQSQINWFISTLDNTPSDYHVIVLTHLSPYGDYIECEWVNDWTDSTSRYTGGTVNQSYVIGNPIGDIVNAWIKGISINENYSFSGLASYLTPIIANHNFSNRGQGIFIGYFHGHYHRDGLCTLKDYPEQHAYRIVASAAHEQTIRRTDLNRTQGTKSEDAFNIVSIDTVERMVYIVRVGANTTKFLEDRKMIKYSY